jgi:hypothetical protein
MNSPCAVSSVATATSATSILFVAFPALKRWALIYRPSARDAGSGTHVLTMPFPSLKRRALMYRRPTGTSRSPKGPEGRHIKAQCFSTG